jgi:la-related protein 1
MEEPNAGGAGAAAVEAADPAGAGVGASASPWRKNTPPPAESGEAAVMGAKSWPALEEARQKVASEPPTKAAAGNAAGSDFAKGPQGPTPPSASSQVLSVPWF